MAAPHVTGVAALAFAHQDTLTIAELKNRLIYCGDPVPALNGKTLSARRLNAMGTLNGCPLEATVYIQPTFGGTASINPVLSNYPFGTSVTLTATAEPGYVFAGWEINQQMRGAANPFTFAVMEDLVVVPLFILAVPFEDFDGVTAPALPNGWTTSRTGAVCAQGDSGQWRTTPGNADTPPNTAFAGDPNCISDNVLQSAPLAVANDHTRLRFVRRLRLEHDRDRVRGLQTSPPGDMRIDRLGLGHI